MTKTIKDFMQELGDADLTVADWAASQGIPRDVAYNVLSGRSKCIRGAARQCARAMGLLPAPASKTRQGHKGMAGAEAAK